MLLWILHHLTALSSESLGGWAKITPRAALAAGMSFAVAVLLGPMWIAWLRRHFRESIKSDSAEIARLHSNKQSTPTMGGLFVVAALTASLLLFGDLTNGFVAPALVVAVGLTLIGVVDDLVKIRTAANGISASSKLIAQLVVAGIAAILLYQQQAAVHDGLLLHLPLVGTSFSLGLWFIPLAIIVIVGSSNAVNLTDGLDGLAGGCLLAATAAMTGFVYTAGHAEWAAYLGVPRIPHAGEMTILAAGMIGGVLGFLWFNCHPAQVFLGNTGALPLGGLLGFLAVVSRQELLLVVVAGVFVAEAISVIVQVGYFKWRRRRLLRCAPLHHHFQLLGWAENKIVVRFWIASALFALLGVASLKLGVPDVPPNAVKKQFANTSVGNATEVLSTRFVGRRPCRSPSPGQRPGEAGPIDPMSSAQRANRSVSFWPVGPTSKQNQHAFPGRSPGLSELRPFGAITVSPSSLTASSVGNSAYDTRVTPEPRMARNK